MTPADLQLKVVMMLMEATVCSLALERCNPAILDCRQFACPQAVFDFLLKQNIFQANETAGSLVIILQAGRLLVCRQADF